MDFKPGGLYYLKFYDHFLGNDDKEEIVCEVCGWVTGESENYVQITYWKTSSALGYVETEKSNAEKMKILKSTICDFAEVL